MGYNAHPHFLKQGRIINDKSNIIRAVDGNIVFSPSDDSGLSVFPGNLEMNSQKSSASTSQGKIKQKHIGVFSSQENVSKKFNSRNDPYQNALPDKTVVRTASEKRVSNHSKLALVYGTLIKVKLI